MKALTKDRAGLKSLTKRTKGWAYIHGNKVWHVVLGAEKPMWNVPMVPVWITPRTKAK